MRTGSTSSSSARCVRIRSRTSSRVMDLRRYRSGLLGCDLGAPQRSGRLERPVCPADEILLDAPPRAHDRARNPVAGEAAVGEHAELAEPEQVGTALALRVDLLAKLAEPGP